MRGKAKGIGLWCAVAAIAALSFAGGRAMAVDFSKAIPDEYRVGGFALGCQAWSFNHYTFFEAIDKTRQTGCRLIEAYPGQKLSPDKPNVRFDHNSSQEVLDAVRKKLDQAGVKLVAYGVVGLGKDEAADRKVFDFAKKMGILTIVTEPEEGSFPLLSRLAKEYDIRVAVHNHPKRPNYKYWSPDYVLQCVKGLDKRVGSCADTGHWMRSGINPIDALKKLDGRVLHLHIKDLNKYGRNAHDVPFGTGEANMKGILDQLRAMHFDGVMSIEYEYHWTSSVPEIKKCVEFVRKYGESLGNK